jgi:hypothetical protein
VVPPGALFDVSAPALGYTRSSFGATSGTTLTAAALPSLSLSAISAKEGALRSFPVYAYAEFTHVRRVSGGLDLGIRIFAQVSSPIVQDIITGGGKPPPGDFNKQFQNMLEQHQEVKKLPSEQKPAAPNLGLTIFGRFSGL